MSGFDRLRGFCLGLVLLVCTRVQGDTASTVRLLVPEDLYASVEVLADIFGEEAKVEVTVASYNAPAGKLGRISSELSGDVLILPDDAALADARRLGIVEEAAEEPLLYKRLSLGVRKGNPEMIFGLSDLARENIRVGIAARDDNYLGRLSKEATTRAGLFDAIEANVTARAASDRELACLLLDDRVDVVICWDTLELLDSDRIVVMRLSWKVCESQAVPVAVLSSSTNRELATRLVDYLTSPTAKEVLFEHAYWTGSGEHGGERMDRVARTKFAPMYPMLARQIAEDYGRPQGVCVDIGCGPGQLAIEVAKGTNMQVWGLDIEPQAIEVAKRNAEEAGVPVNALRFAVGDAHNIPLPDNFADLVVSRGSIFFWRDKARGLREIQRILKPGGVAYVGGGFSRYFTVEQIKQMKPNWDQRGEKAPPFVRLDPVATARAAGIADFKVDRTNGRWIEFRK